MRKKLTESYLVIMLLIYPLFIVHGYSDLLYKKWYMFFYSSFLFVILSMMAGIFRGWKGYKQRAKSALSLLDKVVLGYFLCVIISYIGAADKGTALWGVDTWYMGGITQFLFVGIYFGISRGYVKNKVIGCLCAGSYLAVSGMVILQRFNIDVWSFYEGMPDEVKLNFVTTTGQVTWTSSYISILLIFFIGCFYKTKIFPRKLLYMICIWVGFATLTVLNCDSGVIAVVCAILVLLWQSLGSTCRMKEFLEIIIIGLSAIGSIGILEKVFLDRLIPIDEIYIKIAGSPLIYIMMGILIIFYFQIYKNKIQISESGKSIRTAKTVYLFAAAFAAAAVAVTFILHGKGYFAGSPTENYFRFTVWWGNSRGFIWRTGAAVFADFNLWRKLFGCGPDGFTPYAYGLMGDAINEFWHNQIVPNVHNEWFNAVINYGLIGGGTYLAIFVLGAGRFMKRAVIQVQEHIELFGIGLAAVGYITHNILCYQQLIGTPLIFILLGMGEAIVRNGQKEGAAAP